MLEFELEFSQKPPFNISAPRFNNIKTHHASRKELDPINEDKESGIHDINKYKIPFKGKEIPLGGKDSRFKNSSKKLQFPGPDQYNIENEWNKKSYNILFAENL